MELFKVIQIIGILLGIIIPIAGYFIIRVIKSNDIKIDKLFSMCDAIKSDMVLIVQRISQLEEAIKWLKEK